MKVSELFEAAPVVNTSTKKFSTKELNVFADEFEAFYEKKKGVNWNDSRLEKEISKFLDSKGVCCDQKEKAAKVIYKSLADSNDWV